MILPPIYLQIDFLGGKYGPIQEKHEADRTLGKS